MSTNALKLKTLQTKDSSLLLSYSFNLQKSILVLSLLYYVFPIDHA